MYVVVLFWLVLYFLDALVTESKNTFSSCCAWVTNGLLVFSVPLAATTGIELICSRYLTTVCMLYLMTLSTILQYMLSMMLQYLVENATMGAIDTTTVGAIDSTFKYE